MASRSIKWSHRLGFALAPVALGAALALGGCATTERPNVSTATTTPAAPPTSSTAAAPITPATPAQHRLVTDLTGFCRKLAPLVPEKARSLPLSDYHSTVLFQQCDWGLNPDTPPPLNVVAATPYVQSDATENSNLDAARQRFNQLVKSMADPPFGANREPKPVAGLGDRAAVVETGDGADLVVLTRNVTISISWSAPGLSPADARAEAIAFAHAAIAQLPT